MQDYVIAEIDSCMATWKDVIMLEDENSYRSVGGSSWLHRSLDLQCTSQDKCQSSSLVVYVMDEVMCPAHVYTRRVE